MRSEICHLHIRRASSHWMWPALPLCSIYGLQYAFQCTYVPQSYTVWDTQQQIRHSLLLQYTVHPLSAVVDTVVLHIMIFTANNPFWSVAVAHSQAHTISTFPQSVPFGNFWRMRHIGEGWQTLTVRSPEKYQEQALTFQLKQGDFPKQYSRNTRMHDGNDSKVWWVEPHSNLAM